MDRFWGLRDIQLHSPSYFGDLFLGCMHVCGFPREEEALSLSMGFGYFQILG